MRSLSLFSAAGRHKTPSAKTKRGDDFSSPFPFFVRSLVLEAQPQPELNDTRVKGLLR